MVYFSDQHNYSMHSELPQSAHRAMDASNLRLQYRPSDEFLLDLVSDHGISRKGLPIK
jgi:hypothetical protein